MVKKKRRNIDEAIASIEEALRAKDDFMGRVKLAEANSAWCADLLAEAVDMHVVANGLETVGHDGRVRVTPQDVFASHCLIAARDAYRRCTPIFIGSDHWLTKSNGRAEKH